MMGNFHKKLRNCQYFKLRVLINMVLPQQSMAYHRTHTQYIIL